MKLKIRFTGKLLPKFSKGLLSLSFLLYLYFTSTPAIAILNFTRQTDTLKALNIGDKMPDFFIPEIINYSKSSAKFSDFKGKLIIIDFWATWCGPCVGMIPRLDSLQKQFPDQLQVLPVAYQSRAEVETFLAKFEKEKHKHFSLPDVVGDKKLVVAFPHNTLPHFVWIGTDGIVRAITEYGEVTAANIETLLKGGKFSFREKTDPIDKHYDFSRPLSTAKDIIHRGNTTYNAVLTPYQSQYRGEYHVSPVDSVQGRRITFINLPLDWIYREAYGTDNIYLGENCIVYKTADSGHFKSLKHGAEYHDWLVKNSYCYELKVPAAYNSSFFELMREDLSRQFPQYKAELKVTETECLALVRTSSTDLIAAQHVESDFKWTPFGCSIHDRPISILINFLNASYMQNSPIPIVDETDYKEHVDIDLEADMSQTASLNEALKAYDLKFVVKRVKIPMLVISDNPR